MKSLVLYLLACSLGIFFSFIFSSASLSILNAQSAGSRSSPMELVNKNLARSLLASSSDDADCPPCPPLLNYRNVSLSNWTVNLSLPRNAAVRDGVEMESLNSACSSRGRDGRMIDGVLCCPLDAAQSWILHNPDKKTNKSKTEAFRTTILTLATALNSAHIPFHLMGGTLLGWKRECQFIQHTTDIDIGIMEEDWDTRAIDAALTAAGFYIVGCTAYEGYGWELSYHYDAPNFFTKSLNKYNEIKLDIRQMMREKHYTWMGAGQIQSERHARWEGHYHIVPADFLGVAVGVPNDVHKYLSLEYGDYNIVNENFNWSNDANNIVQGIPRWNTTYPLKNSALCSLANRGLPLS